MKKLIIIFFIFSFSQLSFANERFIPIELWLGIPSTGSNELKFYEVNNKQHGGKLKVSGPINWKNKKTGKTIQVYERKRAVSYTHLTLPTNREV